MLVPVQIRTNLKYAGWRLPGAFDCAWLHVDTHRRLLAANEFVRRQSKGQAEILVWDALRSFRTQRHIFEVERNRFAEAHPELETDAVEAAVSRYVRPARHDRPPPHTTGGAVDVTLWWDGSDESLGGFDDFSEHGRVDFFLTHPPTNPRDEECARRRELLRDAMYDAGFIGIPEEWWRFEYGTRSWAEATGETVKLDQILLPPVNDAIAERLSHFPARQVIDVHGVAQVFSSPRTRAAALSGQTKGYYYARTRHHNERQVAERLQRLLGVEDALLTPSGLCAAVAAVASSMQPGRRLIIDQTSYYETRSSLRVLAGAVGWFIEEADFSDPKILDRLKNADFDVAFCDHPRNWLLTNPDLSYLRKLTAERGAVLIVDTSVQPLQCLTKLGLADLMVISLSKDASLGETVAGAIVGSNVYLDKAREWTRARGIVLPPETAVTLLGHLPSLADRVAAVSAKARRIAGFLQTVPEVVEVRHADLSGVGADSGGQVCVRFASPALAEAMEVVVGWNSAASTFPLALACTFGAAFTTFEHFGSRSNPHGDKVLGSDYIHPGWVRIGVGYEPCEAIIDALTFALYAAKEQHNPY